MSLADGTRVGKDDPRVEAYGAVDELNAAVGLAFAELPAGSRLRPLLTRIQNELFDLGADPTPSSGSHSGSGAQAPAPRPERENTSSRRRRPLRLHTVVRCIIADGRRHVGAGSVEREVMARLEGSEA